MTKKSTTPRKRSASKREVTRKDALHLFNLLHDERVDGEARRMLDEYVMDITSAAASSTPEENKPLFLRCFVEGWQLKTTAHARRNVGEILTRLDAGESLESIIEDFDRQRAAKTARKGSATKRISPAVEREKQAREDAEHAIEAAGTGSPHETAGRITLLLMDDEKPESTRSAIQQAIEDLAVLTGISVSHPTVISETYPAMLAAVQSDETWNSTEGKTAEGRHERLLWLVARAEGGEVLDAPAPASKHASVIMGDMMTYRQRDNLAHDIAELLMGDGRDTIEALLVIFDELQRYCQDSTHVEEIATLMRKHLFSSLSAADDAEQRFTDNARPRWIRDVR